MRESAIERYLVARCRSYGAVAEKFVSPGKKGVPDRICEWPLGFTDRVECKCTGGRMKPHQVRDHKARAARGHRVWLIDSKADVDEYILFCLRRHAEAERRENGL